MLICCLRDTGMSVAEIKHYVDLCVEGDGTIETRRKIIFEHKKLVEQKIEQMKDYLTKINKKLECYDLAISKEIDVCNPDSKNNG